MENIFDNYLNFQKGQNQQENEEIILTNEERKSKIMFNEIIDDLIRKKTNKENEVKIQIEKNKKNLLEKFYSMSNTPENLNNKIYMNNININNNTNNNINNNINNINNEKNNIFFNNNANSNINNNYNYNKLNQKENNNFNNNINKNIIIPNSLNPNLITDGQKEYDEIREKYKNERNKKKSSIFKSEDLRISNTNSVHIKKEDFSPINPNMVNQETKNNILIIQKKLFGDNEVNEETSKVENIDEIDDLDFEDLNIKEFKNEDNSINNNNLGKTSNSNFNLTNLDTNNINFDLSSNLKSEINDNQNETNIYFPNEILVEKRAVEYCYYGNPNKKDINNNKYGKYKDFKKQNNRTKNFSVQLVSKLDYYTEDENKMNIKNKKRKGGSNNQEVMNEMNNFIKNLIPQNMGNNLNNNFNGNKFNYGCFDKINNNININNINNNININNTNLAEIISQHQLKQNSLSIHNNNISNNSQKNGSENYLSIINKSKTITSNNNNFNNNKNINKNNNSNIINKIQKYLQKENKIKAQPNFKKIEITQKSVLNNADLNLNENINKTKNKIKMNYRHISNSHIPVINKNNTNINTNLKNQVLNNNIKHKRKNRSVIIKRDSSKDKTDRNKESFLINNKSKEQKIFYHYNTNHNFQNRNENNSLKNNIRNIINQIPPFYKNPKTTKNKKVPISKIIKRRIIVNNLSNSNGSNSINNINNGINNSSHNTNSNSTSNANINSNNISKNLKNNINNINVSSGNKFALLNTLHKNTLIKYAKLTQQIEAINKLKQYSYSGIYFIYVEKIKEGFLFKGIYKRGVSEVNPVCNKIFGVQNTPIALSYEKFLILIENKNKEFIPVKLNTINIINNTKTILLVRND